MIKPAAWAAACTLAATPLPAAGSALLGLVQEAARTGQPQIGPVDGMLGRLGTDALGAGLIAEVTLVERLAGECGRFAVRLHSADAQRAEVASVVLNLCADGSAPQVRP